jgi:hypothetical protein
MLANKWRYVALIVWLISCMPGAMAARLTNVDSSDERKPAWVISQIDLGKRVIVINGVTYRLANAVNVHSASNKRLALNSLFIGMHVGFRLADNSHGRPIISEIWEDSDDN